MRCACGNRSGWYVTAYHCNYSAFNGCHRTPSAYSEVRCAGCGTRWRTKAAYVETLPREPVRIINGAPQLAAAQRPGGTS